MESKNKDINRQKISLALYFIKENNNQELFGKWTIPIGQKYIIGRKDADINIDHPLVSRKHLELIYYTNNLISVRDLGSRNGTYINNAKASPFQEIKFGSKDKLSLGDINNKIVFIENQEIKNSIFEQKENIENDQRVSEATRKIPNYERRRNTNFRFRNREFGPNRNNRFRFRYRFRPRSFQRNNYVAKQKIRDVQSDNNNESVSSETYKEGENKDRRFQFTDRYQKRNFRNNYEPYLKRENEENLKRDNQKEFIGKKVERNKSESKYEKKKNLEKLIENKKIGLEKLKKKLKSIENECEDEENIDEDLKEEELDLFDMDSKQENKKQTIVFRTNRLNNLEFEVPIKDKNLKDLKNVKKIKYLVNGYLVLNVKNKQFVYE